MAAIHARNGFYRVIFRHHGKQRNFSVGKVSQAEAQAKADQVGYLLMRLDQGLIRLPPGGDIVQFLQHDGAIPATAIDAQRVTLATLRDRYLATHGNGTLEAHMLRGIHRHFKHLARELGEGYPIRELSLGDLQRYVDTRAQAKGRRGPLNPVMIQKEIFTLRTAWNWVVRMKIVSGAYPYQGLRYPKFDEKPPFQTRAEIERQLSGLTTKQIGELYDALYLTLPEIETLLAHVRTHALHAWIHPMVATAAHTGARKGELLKMKIGDVDFVAKVVSIQERKRAHGRRTTRRVPLSTELAAILQAWLTIHPGGNSLFAQAEVVQGSKKRSATTGHKARERPTTLPGRRAGIKERERPGIIPLTEDEAGWHFNRTLKDSQWAVVKGWHVLRHAFISACVSKGIDQRLPDSFVGHSTEEQRQRYAHLYPSAQADALKSVFG